MKICTKCKIEKEFTEFYKHKNNPDGLTYTYKTCQKSIKKKYYVTNKITILNENKKYRIKNKKPIRLRQKLYRECHKKEIEVYRQTHCSYFKKKSNEYYKNLKINNPCKLILNNIKTRCNNKNVIGYKNYGGRGIKCLITEDELKRLWFRDKAWLLKIPSIDRKVNNGDYTLENCQFIEWEYNREKAKTKSVLQFNLNGSFVKGYKSITEASKESNTNYSSIGLCCKSKYKSAGGFIWTHKGEI